MRTVTGDLRCGADFRVAIEEVNLHGKAKVAAFPADDVVLIAGSDLKGMEIALNDCAGVNGIAIPDYVAAEGSVLRGPKRDNHHVEMILVSEFPVRLTGESGIGTEVQVSMKIYRNGIALGFNASGRVGVKPICVELDFTVIELVSLLSLYIGNEETHYQNGKRK